MTLIEKLDNVLSFMVNSPFMKRGVTLDVLNGLVNRKKGMDLTDDELEKIIEKLIEKGFVSVNEKSENFNDNGFYNQRMVKYYDGKLEGAIFCSEGGFQGEISKRDAENTRVDKIERAQKTYRRTTIWLTVILAFGTSIAAWYYWLEVCHKFRWFGM